MDQRSEAVIKIKIQYTRRSESDNPKGQDRGGEKKKG